MTIVLHSDDLTAPDLQTADTLGGQDVHYSVVTNPSDRNKGNQHDRAGAIAIGYTPAESFTSIIGETFEKARTAAIKALDDKAPARHHSGSTMTLAMYDPQSYTIALGSLGDSPAYVVLSDGEHHYAIPVSDNRHSRYEPSMGRVVLSEALNYDDQPRQGVYSFHAKPPVRGMGSYIPDHSRAHHEGLIKLDELIAAVREHKEQFPLNRGQLKVSLVVTSDGANAALKETTSWKDPKSLINGKQLAAAMVTGSDDNKAARISDSAIGRGTNDNVSVVVFDNLERGKGQSVAACVCDGFQGHGYLAAEAAITTFEQEMQHVAEKHREPLPGQFPDPRVQAQEAIGNYTSLFIA